LPDATPVCNARWLNSLPSLYQSVSARNPEAYGQTSSRIGSLIARGVCNVPEIPNPNRTFRFGLYELNGHTGELRKDGKSRPRLQGQPLEILLQLVEHPGELVTREELRQRLWPADTFVDYDHSLNTAVNKVREALNDSADNPRFIQTVPRRGYRFIASVENADDAANAKAPNGSLKPFAEPANLPEKRSTILSDSRDLPAIPHGTARLLFSLIQVMYLSFYIVSLAGLHEMETVLEQMLRYPKWLFVVVVVTALAGIPVRLYLLTGAIFGYRGLSRRFLSLFPALFPLDELWALSPFLIVDRIGIGLALAATAALLYVPFAQRSLLLMGEHDTGPRGMA
jgi:DNA-binding winged helix-turn-helix (wHTH) protein